MDAEFLTSVVKWQRSDALEEVDRYYDQHNNAITKQNEHIKNRHVLSFCYSEFPAYALVRQWYSLSDKYVNTKLRVTEGYICFLMCSFYFIIALYLSIRSTKARIGTLSSS